jgi:hypothetical protein
MVRLLGCVTRLLVLAVAGLAAFAVVLWAASAHQATDATAPPTPESGAAASAAPAATPAPVDAGAAATGRQKLVAAERTAQAAPAGSHQPVTVTLTEAEVNAIAVPELEKETSFPLKQPRVLLQTGQVAVQGQAAMGPALLPVTVAGNVAVDGGVPRFVVTSVRAGGIAAPQSLVDQLTGELNSRFTLTPEELPITVQSVTVGDHTLTISGVTK